jgi:cytochrome c oxidase assembly factor CtaG
MNTTTFFRKGNVVLFVTGTILIVAMLISASAIEGPTKMTATMIMLIMLEEPTMTPMNR